MVRKIPAVGSGNPLQYSYVVNPMDRGAWQATVHRFPRVRHDWEWAWALEDSVQFSSVQSLSCVQLFVTPWLHWHSFFLNFLLNFLFCIEQGQLTIQYSCLENLMDGGAWWAAVHGIAKSQRRLSDFTFTFHFHALEKEMAPHSSVLAWRIPGTGRLVGFRVWGRTESDMTEAT